MGKTIKNITLSLFIFSLTLLLAAGFLSLKTKKYDWLFIYYMSYDNNLDKYSDKILNDLARGITNNKIAVVTQADFIDDHGMKRIELYKTLLGTKRKETTFKSEDSADPNELKKYLDWVRESWKAENYCVVFLNHGGLLNNMCLDERPFHDRKENAKFPSGKWLPASEVGKILAEFNRNIEGKVRLLFLQQCARASIQNLYNFTGTSEYIMASPVEVGAPNTYYTQTLKVVAKDPNITGDKIAKTIMLEDKDYTIYTLVDSNELEKLPEKLSPVLEVFNREKSLKSPEVCAPLFKYEDEKFYDIKSYLHALSLANNNIADSELNTFFDWVENHLIKAKQINTNPQKPLDKSWRSGLSIYIPSDPNQLSRYDFLPLYKQTNLESLMRRTINNSN